MGSGLGKEEAHHLESERGQQEPGQSGPACEVGGGKERGGLRCASKQTCSGEMRTVACMCGPVFLAHSQK